MHVPESRVSFPFLFGAPAPPPERSSVSNLPCHRYAFMCVRGKPNDGDNLNKVESAISSNFLHLFFFSAWGSFLHERSLCAVLS